jgi:hypothetical protein
MGGGGWKKPLGEKGVEKSMARADIEEKQRERKGAGNGGKPAGTSWESSVGYVYFLVLRRGSV